MWENKLYWHFAPAQRPVHSLVGILPTCDDIWEGTKGLVCEGTRPRGKGSMEWARRSGGC